jgi:hypothetical protein
VIDGGTAHSTNADDDDIVLSQVLFARIVAIV